MSTAGASVLGMGYLMVAGYLGFSLVKGRKASGNPWGAKGLEWEATPSPPPTENFLTPQVVTEEAYSYNLPAREVNVTVESEHAHV